MAEKLTFLHTADLHLGAPLRGLRALSPKWANRVAAAIPAAFNALVETAVSRHVDFVVIAGDIFDQATPSYANYKAFAAGLERLDSCGIPSYLCTGNHDPYTTWRSDLVDLPVSTYMFPANEPGFTVFRRNNKPVALLGGRGFFTHVFSENENIAQGITRQAAQQACGVDAPFAIGVLHSGLNLDPFKAPANPSDLLRSGMDYWALGHIHQPWQDSSDNPRIVFPGCIQGRDIKETGARGCAIVTLEAGKPNQLEFVPLASVVWQLLSVDISACQTIASVQEAVMQQLFLLSGTAACDYMVERVVLTGTTSLHALLQEPGILNDLREDINAAYAQFFCDSILDHTQAPYQKEALQREGLFPAVLLQTSWQQSQQTEQTLQYLQEAFLAKDISLPADCADNIALMQQNAESMALDLLGQGVGA